MHEIRYYKPSLTNLKGKKGRTVLEEIRNTKAEPMDNIRDEADACIERILARRRGKTE